MNVRNLVLCKKSEIEGGWKPIEDSSGHYIIEYSASLNEIIRFVGQIY